MNIYLIGLFFIIQKLNMSTGVKEYCLNTEPFEAACLKNEVIVMNSASYGRMRKGRCLEDEGDVSSFGNGLDILGCYVNVLHIFDKRCSGKNQCYVMLASDVDLQREKPCHRALNRYLEASYDCVTVIEEDRSCVVTLSAASAPLHLLHSAVSKACGTSSQPWVIEAPAGQQINITLVQFSSDPVNSFSEPVGQQYGYVIDKSVRSNVSLNRQHDERKQVVYTSASNVIEMVLKNANAPDTNEHIPVVLIGFIATGCSNLIPPEDTWLRRNNNEATIGCYSSRQSWNLRCLENQWVGVIGNCSRELVDQGIKTIIQSSSVMNNQVIFIVAVAVVGLIVCISIIISGAICLKRYSVISDRKHCQAKNANVWQPSVQQSLTTGVRAELLA